MKCPKCGIDVFAHGEFCEKVSASDLKAKLESLPRMNNYGQHWVELDAVRAIIEGKD